MTYCHVTSQLDQHDRRESAREAAEEQAEQQAEASHSLLDLIVEASGNAVLIQAIERLRDEIGIALHDIHLENITTGQGVDDDFADYLEAV
ncbi:hypothetical protein [Endozoicomonas sp. GU-1]|uniref:hypothetical protein n=1 Tax=Endozoicomonas sp. GU-1 TaxID=3009078 RepID=UPI0022B568E7|nr:hypothetical protein [Endozoicomonas sp. GU-1]WBA79584.1 hypothetical protein O2T12_14465 [Endozoicomonas sp. GU-1]